MQKTLNTYSIGEVAKMFNLTVPTLRYYDKEGLIPNLYKNSSGIRQFTEENLGAIQTIECLKKAGMPIKDIKSFIDLCGEGDGSLNERLEMFKSLKKNVIKQIVEMQKTLDMINFKCHYYETAVNDGTEANVKEAMNILDISNIDYKK